MKNIKHISLATLVLAAASVHAQTADIVATEAYSWRGDTIFQSEFYATAPTPEHIVSTYSAQPGYRFPIAKEWKLKNDISSYPRLTTPNTLHAAIYNLGLDEMVNAVEPDTTLRTGKEWAGVWTRDVSYSILLSMAYMQPEASKISLMKKVNPNGVIIQDTGSGGAWPVSSDREIWTLAAYELYKVTGDRSWLEYIYPIIKRSLDDDALVVAASSGLIKGETSFIDWREQSYPRWMQTADIYSSEALGTSVVHAQALATLAEIAAELGHKAEAKEYQAKADALKKAINDKLWLDDKGYYAMYNYGRNFNIINPRAETLGESLAILYDIAPAARAASITEHNPVTPFGAAIFFPQIADMPPYHNNSLWPWVGAYWAMANAKAGNEQGTLEAIGSVFRPAALFATNKENFVLDNGDIATELNSSNMLWCLAGNLAITNRILFGIHFEKDGLAFSPFVPKSLAADRSLDNFRYRDAILNISIRGYGDRIKSFKLNGKEQAPFIPASVKGINKVEIVMADNDIAPMKVNHTANAKAPLTPIAWIADGALMWNPIEYIDHYVVLRNGERIALTHQTSYPLGGEGEYQVIGVDGNGVESFASEPRAVFATIVASPAGESTVMRSDEVSYQPKQKIEGYTGAGFVETDRKSGLMEMPVDVSDDGIYSIAFRYANGNGPVNTENKCAIRTLLVDGKRVGTIVMPQRGVGNWDDWGMTNYVSVPLAAGRHTIALELRPENTNMNIDTNHALVDCAVLSLLEASQGAK